jgi:hypothetical protein
MLGWLVALATFPAEASAQGVCIPTPVGKWCPVGGSVDVPVYFHSSVPHSILNPNYVAVKNAMTEWNLENLGIGYNLVDAGACGQCDGVESGDFPPRGIVVKMAPLGPDGCTTRAGNTIIWAAPRAPGAIISPMLKAFLRLNSNQTWTAADRATTARHEMGHALGMGHLSGCPNTLLMTDGRPCGVPYTLDSSALSGLACLYGSPEGDCARRRGIRVVTSIADNRFLLENCPCTAGCAASVAPEAGPAVVVTYELSINENGGPYEAFANLTDADWVDGSYTHSFARSYTQAKILMRVLEDGVFVEQAETTNPVDIAVGPTAAPAAPTSRPARVFPNPLAAATSVEFALATDAPVELSVFDAAGRRVLTLDLGLLTAGAHRIPISREALQKRGAHSGVFFYLLRMGSRTEQGKLLLLE